MSRLLDEEFAEELKLWLLRYSVLSGLSVPM